MSEASIHPRVHHGHHGIDHSIFTVFLVDLSKVNSQLLENQKTMAKSKARAPSASPRGKSSPPTPDQTDSVPPQGDSPSRPSSSQHDEAPVGNSEKDCVTALDFACPLCIAKKIVQPVVLHSFKDAKDGQHHVCLACHSCACRWLETALEDGTKRAAPLPCPRCLQETDVDKPSDLQSLSEFEELIEQQQNARSGSKKGSLNTLVAPAVCVDNLLTTTSPQSAAVASTPCVMCDQERAVVECTTCNCVLCSSCVDKTHKGSRLQSHVITEIGNIRRCERHPEMAKTIYCFECGEDICSRCFFAGHKLHQANDMLELSHASIEKCAEGMKALASLRDGEGFAANKEAPNSSFAEEIECAKKDHALMESQIVEAFQSLRQALDAREAQLRHTLAEFFDGKLSVLQGRSRLLLATTDQIDAVASSLAEAAPTIANVNTMMYTSLFQPRIDALKAQLTKAIGGGPGSNSNSVREIMEPIKEVRFVLTPAEHSKVLTLLESTGTVELPRPRQAKIAADAASKRNERAMPTDAHHQPASTSSGSSNWKAASLNISTQLPDVPSSRNSGGAHVPSLPPNISKRRQHLTLSEEVEMGEPSRKSTERVTNATLGGLGSHFMAKRQPPPPQQPTSKATGDVKPSDEKNPRGKMMFELKL